MLGCKVDKMGKGNEKKKFQAPLAPRYVWPVAVDPWQLSGPGGRGEGGGSRAPEPRRRHPRGRCAALCSAAPGCSSAPCVVLFGCRAASCSGARGAPPTPIPQLKGAPPPFVRLLMGASPPVVTPLPVAPLLRALSLLVAVLPLAPPLVGLRCGFRLGPPPLVRLLVLLLSEASLPIAVPFLFAPVLPALSCEIVVLPLAPFVLGLPCCLLLGWWALVRPFCDVPWMSCCLSLCRSSSLICYVRCLSRLLCCLLLCCSWGSAVSYASARGRSSALRDTARGRFAAYRSTPPARSPAPCAIYLGCCAVGCSAACGALRPPMLGHVGTPPPFVRLLMDVAPQFALPLPVATLLRPLSCAVDVPPRAPPLVGVCCRLCLGSWALLRPLCDRSWALCCPMLYRT